ncbi:Fatty acid hydroxylase family (carotene hydroxylase/sterol desaturase) [hydrothermal vent metagenome]|uniref:Fatty acid hydroxylase family (Carotene hydroxylase/sterol desaturase) n=1 Tax=hydrothermal vent metagenome TaxID=652676 RepID=A0A3B0U4S5_9ZZZZ
MEILGVSDGAFRMSIFAGIFAIMTVLEAWLPRRKRRFERLKRWPTNIGLLLADIAAISTMGFVVPVSAVLIAIWAAANGWGLLNNVDWPIWVEWIIAIVVLDLVIWSQHLITHKIPLLWRLHRVHHSDVEMDATTAIRFHPVEIIFSVFVKSAAILLLGPAAIVVVIFEALVNGSAIFNHANFSLPPMADRLIRLLLVTPDMHRVHHSVHVRETDSNYGFALSIWDRIFGTYIAQPKDGHDKMVIGLNQWQDEAPNRWSWALALPFYNPPRSTKKSNKN